MSDNDQQQEPQGDGEMTIGDALALIALFGVLALVLLLVAVSLAPYLAMAGLFRAVYVDLEGIGAFSLWVASFAASVTYLYFLAAMVKQSMDMILVCRRGVTETHAVESEYYDRLRLVHSGCSSGKLRWSSAPPAAIAFLSWSVQAYVVIRKGPNYTESISLTGFVVLMSAIVTPILVYFGWKLVTRRTRTGLPSTMAYTRHLIARVRMQLRPQGD